MKKLIIQLIVIAAAAGAIAGCRTSPIYNVEEQTIVSNVENVSADQVRKAIIRAGASLGWQMKDVVPGQIMGTLHLRDHMAQVDISYSPKSYSITYNNSENLKYDEGTGTIHSNYNGWVQNLQRNIDAQLGTI